MTADIDDLKKLRWCSGQVCPDILQNLPAGRRSVLEDLETRKRNMEETEKKKDVTRKKDRGAR